MLLLSTIETFKVPLTFFFKGFAFAFPFLEDFTVLSVHGVGISPFLWFEVAILSRVFYFFSSEIII
jgi:hypothetical protein